MNVKEQSEVFIRHLETRRRNPAKPATLAAYRSYLNAWILPELGEQPLEAVENGVLRSFVTKLSEAELSAASITGIVSLIKQIIRSCVDQNGNSLYPRVWNNDFMDLPIIDPTKQKAPVIGREALSKAICEAQGQFKPLLLILAGTGARVSEILALRGVPTADSSYYDRDKAIVVIRKALYHGREQATKSAAGVREVDLDPRLNAILCNETPRTEGFCFTNSRQEPLASSSRLLRDVATKAGIPGFHSLRRFRRTHLESENVPAGLCDFWMGHQGKGMAGRYVKIGSDIEARKQWAEKAGLGFQI